nr:hypothetical protein [Bacteroidota bacterium]
MKHKAKLLFVLGCLILINHAAIAQPQDDYSLQFKIDIEKKISRSFSTSVFYQNAFNQNASELFYNIIDGGIDYKN